MRLTTAAWLLGLCLVAGLVHADTEIYLTNSTNEPLTIEVDQHGDDLLEEGNEWHQTTTEIAPFATEKVLRFNRFSGVKSGRTYHFETRARGEHTSITLRQQMRGTWYGSRIRYGAEGDDFQSPLENDRSIHRFDTRFDDLPSVLGFKSDFTGGYDDISYTITNRNEPEPVSGDGELKVLTYNIWALPLLASNIDARLEELPDALQGYDVLLIQEAFDSGSKDFLLELADEYPYQTEILDAPNINLFNGGVVIVSRYPIVNKAYKVYPDCVGTDCFTDRGVIYAEVIKNGKAYHVTGTHAASSDSDEARATRMIQFQQIRDLVTAQDVPSSEALLFGGDFNVNRRKFQGDYEQMKSILNASVPEATGYTRATFDGEVNRNAARSGSDLEFLDYVMVANDHSQPIAAENEVRVPRSVSDKLWKVWDLSDHFPVLGEFEFE